MAYRNKTYICFDGDTDMRYYRLMTAWAENEKFTFDFHNAHDLNTARDTSQEESIKRQLRERFANSKLMVVLIGEKTKLLTKFVKWEMEVALKLGLPIIGVNLNGTRHRDERCPPAIRESLAVYVPFGVKIVEYAMANWPDVHAKYRKEGQAGPYYYTDQTYKNLGL
ncbi:TIR domain-containing protein [Mesorhizobium sp. SP-1A]|uniref:TIR domain-containing protein n=1 Tax=Mesorhizobium sp. SP-1A TaxID=3077840 RepID=UPI0028F6F511|nr:TIR domain-containing protein [Mesorhizobium sp. SP-1A]